MGGCKHSHCVSDLALAGCRENGKMADCLKTDETPDLDRCLVKV